MNRHLIIAALAFLAIGATACGRQCKDAREQIIKPTAAVSSYLQTRPSGAELANGGCSMVLDQLKNLPAGAQTIRSIAESRFEHSYSRCLHWERYYRYRCYPRPYPGYPTQCFPEAYDYCSAWDYSTVHEPGYAQALELSRNLDVMSHQANQMCSDAMAGKLADAEEHSHGLLELINAKVKPESDNVYAMACGN